MNGSGSWKRFAPAEQARMQEALREGLTELVLQRGQAVYHLDFVTMAQTDTETQEQLWFRRAPAEQANNIFARCAERSRAQGGSEDLLAKAKARGRTVFPAHWCAQHSKAQLFAVEPGSEEFEKVSSRALRECSRRGGGGGGGGNRGNPFAGGGAADSGSDDTRVLAIYRNQHLHLWQAYSLRVEQHQDEEGGGGEGGGARAATRELWHGTDHTTADIIARKGFNRSYSRRAAYGTGVYFAQRASYSASRAYAKPDHNGEAVLVLSHVLTGTAFTAGRPELLEPPDGFCSVVDRPHNPSIFVTFQDAQAYPEYFVQFKRADGGEDPFGFAFGSPAHAPAFGARVHALPGAGAASAPVTALFYGAPVPALFYGSTGASTARRPAPPAYQGPVYQPQWATTTVQADGSLRMESPQPPAAQLRPPSPQWTSDPAWRVLSCSVQGAQHPAKNAFGDDSGTHWLAERPSGAIPGEWLAFDIGEECEVGAVELISGGDNEAHHITEFQLAYSTTLPVGPTCQTTWHEAVRLECGGKEKRANFAKKIKARYWRVLLVGTRGGQAHDCAAIQRIALHMPIAST
jgi:poly [ADP-ribose] polymerase 10/14/15